MGTPSPLASISAQQMDVTKAPAPVMDYVSADDQFYIRSICSVTGVVIRATARFMRSDGIVVIDSMRHVPNSNRSAALTFHRSIEGYLLSLNVTVEAGTVRRGQCFVQVGLARGTSANPEFGQLLVSDYATVSGELGYPYSLLRSSLDGAGMLRSITGTDPAPNVEVLETVPTGARWRLQSLFVLLATDGNAATRTVQFTIDDGASTWYESIAPTNQTATQNQNYVLAPHSAQGISGANAVLCALPVVIYLFAGWRIGTVTASRQVGDNFSSPKYVVEEWLEL